MCQYIYWLENVPSKRAIEGELSTEEWEKMYLTDIFLEFSHLTGGEPLNRKDFMELFEFASQIQRTHQSLMEPRLQEIAEELVKLAS
jgi:MoaA/NifB/PqqE/SkfB family radical SAM enzyme